jgi:hypothetical protein
MSFRSTGFPLSLILAVGGCSETASPEDCEPETTSVTATVTSGSTPSFDWDPACGVALLLIEEEASDQWSIATPESSWDTPDQANQIFPPVRYGQVPARATESGEPSTLQEGTVYELVLWRIIPQGGSTAGCMQTFENACLLTVKEFTR